MARARNLVCAAAAVIWGAAIYWASSRPNPFPALPRALLSQDKLLHVMAYAVLGALVAGALVVSARRLRRALVLAALLAAVYGATDEWHQGHVPNRDADPADLVADAVGGIVGALAMGIALRGGRARASIGAGVGHPRI